MAALTLEDVAKTFPDGTHAVEGLDLQVGDGELLVLLGPSGCGKTTVLRMVAGLESPTRGTIRVGDRRIDHLPPGGRDVAMIFQNYALYPHKSVRKNLEFPLKMGRIARGTRDTRVREVADLLDLTELLEKRPGHLSGGQQQRVAIGRALVREPAVFLMDEPLSNLDAQLRTRIRSELGALQRRLGITTLFVTHDQTEAMTLGHRIAVLRAGRLQQVGTPDELYERPANVFVAGFAGQPGMNLLAVSAPGVGDGSALVMNRVATEIADARRLPPRDPGAGDPLCIGWRPEALELRAPDDSDALLSGVVRVVESLGSERLIYVDTELVPWGSGEAGEGATLVVRTRSLRPSPQVHERVGVHASTDRAYLFSADGRLLAVPAKP